MKASIVLDHQVLHLADLRVVVVLRVDERLLEALFPGVLFDPELDLVEEVGLEVRNGKADLLDLGGDAGSARPEAAAAAISSVESFMVSPPSCPVAPCPRRKSPLLFRPAPLLAVFQHPRRTSAAGAKVVISAFGRFLP